MKNPHFPGGRGSRARQSKNTQATYKPNVLFLQDYRQPSNCRTPAAGGSHLLDPLRRIQHFRRDVLAKSPGDPWPHLLAYGLNLVCSSDEFLWPGGGQ